METGVYILQSEKNDRFYIGSTKNIKRRLKEHKEGYVKATENLHPLKMRRFIPCDSIQEARKSEYRLKNYKRRDITEKVVESGVFPWDYEG